jgi:hypothetical protein
MATVSDRSGLVYGNGFSKTAMFSISSYLWGKANMVEPHFRGLIHGRFKGPGECLRDLFRGGFPVFMVFPVLWLFLTFLFYLKEGEEVCWDFGYGMKLACHVVKRESFYTFTDMLRHSYWTFFFMVSEGLTAPVKFTTQTSLVLVVVGVLVSPLVSFGGVIITTGVLSIVWSQRNSFYYVRWVLLLTYMVNSTIPWVLLEYATGSFSNVDATVIRVVSKKKVMVPHRFFALEVPTGTTLVSDAYFSGRSSSAMTEDERVLALVGDRFLKLLAARWLVHASKEVSYITALEALQMDDKFLAWTDARVECKEIGKKTRSSFPEVLWGEIYLAWEKKLVSFDQVWEAFVGFQKDMTTVTTEMYAPVGEKKESSSAGSTLIGVESEGQAV